MAQANSKSGPRLLLAALVALGTASLCVGQQLAITSPPAGTVFSPGQTINVTVSVTSGQVLAVQVGAQDIGFTPYLTTSPYSFTLTVPLETIGARNLFAVGLIGNETVVISPSISIDVEPGTQPTKIAFQQSLMTFGYTGQQRRIGVTAIFGDSSTLDISKSSKLSLSSNNSNVVSVDPTGLMTAQAPGSATLTASYQSSSSTLQVIGPTGIRGDLDGDGLVTSDDLLLLETMLGTTPTGPNDARDLNGDGKIDILDVNILVALCTGQGCNTRVTDVTPPITSFALSPQPNAGGWNNSPVTVNLTSVDNPGGTGVKQIQWSLTGAQAGSSAVPGSTTTVTISAEGTTTLTYFGTDSAGNQESPKTLTIQIDKTPPTSQVHLLPTTESASSFTIQWSGADVGAGIQDFTIFVSDNGGPFAPFQTNTPATSAIFTGKAGHTYGFYSISRDLAGNVEAAKSAAESTTLVVSCVSNLNGRGTPSGLAPARIDVTWTGISSTVSYNVLRGTVSGGPYTLLGITMLPAFSDRNGLVNGGTYYYVVQPINSAGGVICQSNEAAIAIPNKPR